jgi:hypothetical protein
MKKYKITRIDSKVWCKETNQIDINDYESPDRYEKEWQEAESKLSKEEYEVLTYGYKSDSFICNFIIKSNIGFEFFGELNNGTVNIIER